MKKLFFVMLFCLVASASLAQVSTFPADWGTFTGTDPFGRTLTGKGYARYAVTNAAVIDLLDTPTAGSAMDRLARHAIIVVDGGDIRIRYDGVDPTATEGELVADGTRLVLENKRSMLVALRMIATVAGPVEVTITYGR